MVRPFVHRNASRNKNGGDDAAKNDDNKEKRNEQHQKQQQEGFEVELDPKQINDKLTTTSNETMGVRLPNVVTEDDEELAANVDATTTMTETSEAIIQPFCVPIASFSNMKKPTIPTNYSNFSQLELRDMRDSFMTFDIEGRGFIKCGEFRQVLLLLKEEEQEEENGDGGCQGGSGRSSTVYPHLDQILEQLRDRNDNDTMDFEQYLQLMQCTTLQHRMMVHQNDPNSNVNVNNQYTYVFELFDLDNKGYITIDDLQRVANDLGEHDMTKEELQEMIDRAQHIYQHPPTPTTNNASNKTTTTTTTLPPPEGADNNDDEKNNNDSNNADNRSDKNYETIEGRVTLEEFTNIMTMKLNRFHLSSSRQNTTDAHEN